MTVDNEVPQAMIKKKKGISIIWVVPVIAIVVGLGLVYTAMTTRGPEVTILFSAADGIKVKKTKVKYKDIDIGKVKKIKFTEDFSQVKVTVRLAKMAEQLLSENTRFWIVRPRLRGVTVSGLETVLSGAYIEIDPGKPGNEKYDFIGLDEPPRVTDDRYGKLFTLKADVLGSLDYGSPVYYRDINVGQIVGYKLQEDGNGVDIQLFVNEPYDSYIKEASKFWLVSGVEFEMDTEGFHIYSESLVSILLGGVAFLEPSHLKGSKTAKEGAQFDLYKNRKEALTQHFNEKEYYVLKFTQNIRGLSIGAPVEFKGFPIGKVVDIGIEFHLESQDVLVPVRIEVESERLAQLASNLSEMKPTDILHTLVKKGLRAELLSANLLTGQLYVALDFFDKAKPAEVLVTENGLQQIPTLASPIEELTEKIPNILKKINRIPIEKIGKETLATIKGLRGTLDKLKKVAGSKDLFDTLKHLKEITRKTNAIVAADSRAIVELQRMLKDISNAAKSVGTLADQLERNPESLIRGKRRD